LVYKKRNTPEEIERLARIQAKHDKKNYNKSKNAAQINSDINNFTVGFSAFERMKKSMQDNLEKTRKELDEEKEEKA